MTENRLTVLDALRGLAALAVALVHFTVGMKPSWFQWLSYWGWLGVDVFFVISGFVIPLVLAKSNYGFPRDYHTFLAKRVTRLHPPYLAVVLVMIAISVSSGKLVVSDIPESFASHAFLLNGVMQKTWISDVFWSLAIEMQFYIFIGIVMPLLSGSSHRCSSVYIAILLVALLPVPKAWLTPHLPLFCFGIAAFWRHSGQINERTFLAGILLSGVTCAISLGIPQAVVGGATSLLITGFKWNIPKPLLSLGAISYSLYLLHPIIAEWLIPLLGGEQHSGVIPQILTVGCAMLLSFFAAWIWYNLFELPSQKFSSSIRYDSGESKSRI